MLSMTGYGEAQREDDGLSIRAELRTVNNRHLKIICRLPEGFGALEPKIENLLRARVRRGSVQLNLAVNRNATDDGFRINTPVLTRYYEQLLAFQSTFDQPEQVSLEALLPLPGVIVDAEATHLNVETTWPTVELTINEALARLNEMRTEEGASMASDLRENCEAVGKALDDIEGLATRSVELYEQRLLDRIRQLLQKHDLQVEPSAVIREVGIFAERVDISEEMVRLRSHLQQFDAIMDQPEPAGRKLEFLIQELLRETNTIGSKANDAQIATHVVQIKTNIERLREMIQNVE